MRPRQLIVALALAGSTFVLPSCASTTVERVWQSPEWAGSFDHVVVFGMSKRPGVRRAFEEAVVEALQAKGVRATPSYELFPGDTEQTQEEIASVLSQRQIDGILVARLVSIDSRHRYVDPAPFMIMGGPPMGFYGYYHFAWGLMYQPGYGADYYYYPVVIIESNLYAVQNDQLVWSGISETFDPDDVQDAVKSYGRTMTRTLLDAGLVRRVLPR